ncbi:MAG: hypothetical protein V1722_02790 [Candidatus Micrarchaeota archaeon]
MNNTICKNCNLEFESSDARQCPRCSSANITGKSSKYEKPVSTQTSSIPEEVAPATTKVVIVPENTAAAPVAPTAVAPRRFVFNQPLSDTKESWKKFHNNTDTAQTCPGCGGVDFEFVWKRKEKICKKCGEIQPLRRR